MAATSRLPWKIERECVTAWCVLVAGFGIAAAVAVPVAPMLAKIPAPWQPLRYALQAVICGWSALVFWRELPKCARWTAGLQWLGCVLNVVFGIASAVVR